MSSLTDEELTQVPRKSSSKVHHFVDLDPQKWTRVFKTLDTNSDGQVSVAELRAALLAAGAGPSLNLSETEVDAILTVTDTNHNGIIEFDEFLALMESNDLIRHTLYGRVMEKIGETWLPMNARQYAREHYNCRPPPLFMIGISIAQILVYVGFAIGQGVDAINGCPGCYMQYKDMVLPGLFTFNGVYRVLVYPFVTYAFLHNGLGHIYGNVFLQLLVGVPLELVHKWRVVPLYALGVITGAMTAHVFDPSSMLVGASAGVFALVAAAVAQTIMNWSEMPEPWLRLLVAGGYLINNIIVTAIIQPLASPICKPVSWTAHLGGAVTGLLFGIYILKNFRIRPWEVQLQRVCLSIYAVCFLVLLIGCVVRSPGDQPWHTCQVVINNETLVLNINRTFEAMADWDLSYLVTEID